MEIASVLGKAVAIAQCAAIFALVGCSAGGPRFLESRSPAKLPPRTRRESSSFVKAI